MYLTPEVKKNIFKEYGQSEFDTGSIDGQVALFTFRIRHLTETERSLVRLVGKRRKLLDYLKRKDIEKYRELIKKLNIRK